MKRKNTKPVNTMMRAAAVLLCLVAASLYLVTGLYARYTTSATGSDGARVAKFEIVTSGQFGTSNPFTVAMKPGETQTRRITVQNNSEVAVRCTLTAMNETGNLPIQLTWKEEGTNTNSHIFEMGANQKTPHNYVLTIDWPETADKSVGLSREMDHIIVTILCEQID